MPIEFDKHTLDKVAKRTGVYRSLELRPVNKVLSNKSFVDELKSNLLLLIEESFHAYAKEHKGVTQEVEDKAWQKFKRQLLRRL